MSYSNPIEDAPTAKRYRYRYTVDWIVPGAMVDDYADPPYLIISGDKVKLREWLDAIPCPLSTEWDTAVRVYREKQPMEHGHITWHHDAHDLTLRDIAAAVGWKEAE